MPEWSLYWRTFMKRSPSERAQLLRTAWSWFRSEGPRATLTRLTRGARRVDERDAVAGAYAEWCRRHTPDARRLSAMAEDSRRFPYRPLISIVTPVYNTDPQWLEPCARAVIDQAYDRWEWHVGNDGSTRPETIAALARIASLDPRISVHTLPANQGISAATNLALAHSRGDYVGLMDSDDALLPHALFRVVEHLNAAASLPDVVYTDEDKLELDGSRVEPYFKPDWSPELARSNMFACHFLLARRQLVHDIGGFRTAFDFSQDHDLLLRLMEKANRFDHVPDIVYHWRKIPQSGATIGTAKPAAHISGRAALQDYLDRNGLSGEVIDVGPPGFYRARYRITGSPLVSVIAPGAGAEWRARVSDASGCVAARIECVDAVDEASGSFLLFLSPRIVPEDPDWLGALLEVTAPPGVGVVSGTVVGPDGLLREAGLVLGAGGGVAPAFEGYPARYDGYFGSGLAIHNASAVSSRCVLTPRDVYERFGGFQPGIGADAQAVDYCLRIWAADLRVVVTPWARLLEDGPTTGFALPSRDLAWLRERWGERMERDPFYNRHLDRSRPTYHVGA